MSRRSVAVGLMFAALVAPSPAAQRMDGCKDLPSHAALRKALATNPVDTAVAYGTCSAESTKGANNLPTSHPTGPGQ